VKGVENGRYACFQKHLANTLLLLLLFLRRRRRRRRLIFEHEKLEKGKSKMRSVMQVWAKCFKIEGVWESNA